MYKKFLLLLWVQILSIPLIAQLEIKEGSFREVPGFVNINSDPNYQNDDNDLPFAVVKVRTENITDKQRRELRFESNMATGIVLEYHTGEVWVYLTAKYADYLKISHPDFSSIEFTIPFDLQPKKGYEMALVYKPYVTPTPVKDVYNYLIVKANQPNATIYIDDEFVGEQEAYKSFLAAEKHTWRIECELYHTESGVATIPDKEGENVTIEKVLRPAYGYINVTSSPESGAIVYIDGKKVGQTPFKTDKLASGEHKVRVMKEMFAPAEKTITVTDNNTTQASMSMTANFVNVIVNTDSEASIYIDNEKKGIGSWKGRLSEGNHTFEARKTSHKTSIENIQLVIGQDETIVIPNPTPIYGTIDVVSNPIGANIIIDGKNYGNTPRVLTNVLIGSHELKIEKANFAPLIKTIALSENNKLIINEKLPLDYTAKSQKLRNKILSKDTIIIKGRVDDVIYYPDIHVVYQFVKEFPDNIRHSSYYTIDSIAISANKWGDFHAVYLVHYNLETDKRTAYKIGNSYEYKRYDTENSFVFINEEINTNEIIIFNFKDNVLKKYNPFKLKPWDGNTTNCEYNRSKVDETRRTITTYKLLWTECSWWSEKVLDSITCKLEDLY